MSKTKIQKLTIGIAKMNKSKMQKLASEIAKTQAHLDQLNRQAAELRLAEIRKVEMVKNEKSTTLVYYGRRVNVRKNSYGRYLIKEGSRVLDNDYFGSIHDLRFDLVMGQI